VNDAAGSGQKRRGRPRSEKAHQAILDAAIGLLLAQGLKEVSMDEVAEHAGVSKATIYRWWPSKETLALDALYHEWETGAPVHADTGSLRGDLLALLRPWVRQLRTRPYGRVLAALITEARTDPEFAKEYKAHFVELRRDPARVVFRRAIDRGEIPANTDVDLALRPHLRPRLPPPPARPRPAQRSLHPGPHRRRAARSFTLKPSRSRSDGPLDLEHAGGRVACTDTDYRLGKVRELRG
jgi:AcrR family transcriptional regulator